MMLNEIFGKILQSQSVITDMKEKKTYIHIINSLFGSLRITNIPYTRYFQRLCY